MGVYLLQSSLCIYVWMHYLDANKTAGEKARRQLHKNVASNIEQVLAATPHKAPTIRPPTSHHENYMDEQKQDDQLEPTYSSNVRIRDVALKTCQRQWTIGRSGERGSAISVLAARHDDDDITLVKRLKCIYLFVHICVSWVNYSFQLLKESDTWNMYYGTGTKTT